MRIAPSPSSSHPRGGVRGQSLDRDTRLALRCGAEVHTKVRALIRRYSRSTVVETKKPLREFSSRLGCDSDENDQASELRRRCVAQWNDGHRKTLHSKYHLSDGVAMARYGRKAGSKVKRALHERKSGTLRSGRSGRKVKSRKQAIAIGLSEARRSGVKVPRKRASARGRSKAKPSRRS